MTITAVLGLGAGLWLHHRAQLPSKPPTVQQLIRGLGKQDHLLHEAWETAWVCLPDWLTQRCPILQPQSAVEIRRSAAESLIGLGPEAQWAVPDLVQAIWDRDQGVSLAAMEALRSLGPLAKDALPTLSALFTDPAHSNRFPGRQVAAAATLAAIAPEDPQVQKTLIEAAIGRRDPTLRAQLVRVLGTMRSAASAVLPTLIESLRSNDPDVQESAVRAIGEIGAGALDAVPALIELHESLANELTTGPARPFLVFMSVPPPGLKLLPRVNQTVVVECLGLIGPSAQAALPLLARACTNHLRMDRCQSVFAKWQIDQNAAEAVGALLDLLRDDGLAWDRCRVIEYLARIGAEAVPAISIALDDPALGVRRAAARALGQFGSEARIAIPRLQVLARSDSKFAVRLAAESALKLIQPELLAKSDTSLTPAE